MFKSLRLIGLLAGMLAGIAAIGAAYGVTRGTAAAAEPTNLKLADGTDMSVMHYPAQGNGADKTAVLWLPSEHGLTPGLDRVAMALSRQGVETWIADPYTTWFLPVAESSLAQFQRGPLAELTQRLHEQSGKRLVVISSDHGSRVALQVVRKLQSQGHATNLAGAILISPNLYRQTPQPGQPAQFDPIAAATNVPVFLMVPDNSTLRLRLKALVGELRKGGSRAYFQVLPKVRDRFFFRPDSLPAEDAEARKLPTLIRHAMALLTHEPVPERAAPLKPVKQEASKGRTQVLEPYTGNLTPPSFNRVDLNGKRHTLADYRGQVVLLNFWAGWCPPCIHEMPSMVRLKEHFAGQPFHILAVNLGQSRAEVEQFLKIHPVNFPVFLDVRKQEPKRWRVFAFPTSYLIDAQGRIRYGVAGGLEWDSKQAMATVQKLMDEAKKQ